MKLHHSYQRLGLTFLLVLASLSIVPFTYLPVAAEHECTAAVALKFDRKLAQELGVLYPSGYVSPVAKEKCAVSTVMFDRSMAQELGVLYQGDYPITSSWNHAVLLAVSDQQPVNGTLVIESVFSHGPGYVVIYSDYQGTPAPVVGHVWVDSGWSYNVEVPITMSRKLTAVYAILHGDSNQVGVYEFGMAWGADAPARAFGAPITTAFKVYYPSVR